LSEGCDELGQLSGQQRLRHGAVGARAVKQILDLEGQGELAVALRCGRMSPMEAELYVGAGLVGGSEPEAEVEETRMKLRPMLRALGAEGHR